MAIQTINIGNVVNDGLGDDLRTAFQKVNANFTQLASELTVTVAPAGTTGVNLFKEKDGANLVFKNLVSGTKMFLDDTGNSVVINNIAPDAFTRIDSDSGSVLADTYEQITFGGASAPGSTTSRKDIEVTVLGSTVSFKTIIPVTDILTSYDFGFAGPTHQPSPSAPVQYLNSNQLALSVANIDFGTINTPGRIAIDCGPII